MKNQDFKNWRKIHGMKTQPHVGNLLGVSKRTIVEWEKDDDKINPIAHAYIRAFNRLDPDIQTEIVEDARPKD